MSEILINFTPRETRVALVENGILQEAQVERVSRRGYVGNIYKGRVKRVMPGMQAAFVDIGLERAAFLHASDIVRAAQPGPETVTAIDDGAPAPLQSPAPTTAPSITSLLHEGQLLVVQVVKDPIGSKGARCTTQISIPSRYLVLLPQTKMVGVSARIEGETERARLKDIVAGIVGDTPVGYIVRTNAEGCDEAALAGDVAYLRRAWEGIEAAMAQAGPGQRIYEDLPLPLRAMRDLMHESIEKVKVDSREAMTRLQAFVGRFMPALVDRIELYLGQRPIFDLYGVEDEIGRALQKHVPLKSGGYLVIDQTEAMTTVDVNTGSFLGQRNLEETVYRTNLEAAQSAARQLRLRNLGGIIIIDFIDMTEPEHRRQVLRMLEKS
ncbi:MAG: Rne/Rng family ribonuclease, partial [Proteobacteria bacterium]|nr:Rne/Rng family ribonuclease [Pseudomonadota bacterium]